MNFTWLSHPQSYLGLNRAIKPLPPEIEIEVGAYVQLQVQMFGSRKGRKLDEVVSYIGLDAIIKEVLPEGFYRAVPAHEEFLPHFADMDLVEKYGLSFYLRPHHIINIHGTLEWSLKYKIVYCSPKVAAGERVGFFVQYTLLESPLVFKSVLFAESEIDTPKTYFDKKRKVIPLQQLMVNDPHVINFLHYPCDYGAVRDSDTTFKFFTEEEAFKMDIDTHLIVPELDFRDGVSYDHITDEDVESII